MAASESQAVLPCRPTGIGVAGEVLTSASSLRVSSQAELRCEDLGGAAPMLGEGDIFPSIGWLLLPSHRWVLRAES